MPFALVIIGLILIVTGAKDTYQQFGAQVREDFTGEGNFTFWLASIGAVGALGYVESLRVFSRYFMALIIVAMVLRNGGVFDKLQDALGNGPIAPGKAATPPGAEDNLLAAIIAGVVTDTEGVDKYRDVVVAAGDAQKARAAGNFETFMRGVGAFFFGGPAY